MAEGHQLHADCAGSFLPTRNDRVTGVIRRSLQTAEVQGGGTAVQLWKRGHPLLGRSSPQAWWTGLSVLSVLRSFALPSRTAPVSLHS